MTNSLQWGSKKNVSIGDGYNYDVIFPTAYASICLGVFPVLKRNSVEGGNYTIYYTNESNTGCKLITDESKSSGTAQGFAYFTIGSMAITQWPFVTHAILYVCRPWL